MFDGASHDRLYKIEKIDKNEAHLKHITDLERRKPQKDVYLFWSLLKKDKNDWVLQKCTELGVSHFVPLLATRSEKTTFDMERARKIVIEAAEQCGRSDIPSIREPMLIDTAVKDYSGKVKIYVAEQSEAQLSDDQGSRGVFIGPEGGWTDAERQLFESSGIQGINLAQFTLRAETAAVTASAKLLQ